MKTLKTDDAWALFNGGRYKEAIPLLRAAAEALETAENWNDLGACEFKANLPQAEASFRKALALDPLYPLAQVNLGVLLAAQKRYAEALPLLERARDGAAAEQRRAVEELLRNCRSAPVIAEASLAAAIEQPRIVFLVGDFGANGFSEANGSEAWMLYSALCSSRPAWDVHFISIEHVGEHEETARAPGVEAGVELVSVEHSAESIRRASPDLLHIVSPWLKFIPESILEDHPVLMTLVGVDPTEHCTERDLENVRHLIDFGRLALVCECERAQEVLEQHDIKTRALIPPVVPLPAFAPATSASREKLVCGFATSPYLAEHWEPRGLPLLLDLARVSPETQFLLAWRTSPERIEREIASRRLGNVCVRAGRLDMESFFADVDIMLLPFAMAWGSHGSPLSGVEGLLRGKPLLATENVGIAEWLRQDGAGVVTAPTAAALRSGLLQMAAHYKSYSRQARMAARRRFNPDANAAAYQPIYADILESVKGPTLAEWEAATHRVGKELVRGRAALALYYTQPGVANRYIADRFAAPPFDQLNAQETGGHSETHSCEIRRQNGSETVGFRVRNGTAGAGIGTLWFGHRAGQFCGYAGGGRRSQCRGALHSRRCFPHGDQRAISRADLRTVSEALRISRPETDLPALSRVPARGWPGHRGSSRPAIRMRHSRPHRLGEFSYLRRVLDAAFLSRRAAAKRVSNGKFYTRGEKHPALRRPTAPG